MQIEALSAAYVNKQRVSDMSAAKEYSSFSNAQNETDNNKECQCVTQSSGYDWLDEAYALATGHKDGKLTSTKSKGRIIGIDWGNLSRFSNAEYSGMDYDIESGNSTKSKLPHGIDLDFSVWQNLTLKNSDGTDGYKFSDLPADAFSNNYDDFQIAILSIF